MQTKHVFMDWITERLVSDLFAGWYGEPPHKITPMPAGGSNRQYFRLWAKNYTVVGAYNPDTRENEAFFQLTNHFHSLGLPVPKVLAKDTETNCYLVTDLGDTRLFSLLPHKENIDFDAHVMSLYQRVIDHLVVFQTEAAKKIDFSICYPRHAFDEQSMIWDLNYFKYYFLKITGIHFDEQDLEEDFRRFIQLLSKSPAGYFMYRDFQSRNIMIREDNPWFIDYQGGRKGPLEYDIASLLFDAKANIPFHQREDLLSYYMDKAGEKVSIRRETFRRSFYDFVVMRILQALGTYGFRGGVEKKKFFLQSLPYALNNLAWLEENQLFPKETPYLNRILKTIVLEKPTLGEDSREEILAPPDDTLTVRIGSFSYKNGIPADNSGHGGGFVFDCRALPNPGREERYKSLTGKHHDVIRFLNNEPNVAAFFENTKSLVEPAVETYLERGFTSLTISFGCTGGQHRSVYCAEKLAGHLRDKHEINVIVQHFEESNWPGRS